MYFGMQWINLREKQYNHQQLKERGEEYHLANFISFTLKWFIVIPPKDTFAIKLTSLSTFILWLMFPFLRKPSLNLPKFLTFSNTIMSTS